MIWMGFPIFNTSESHAICSKSAHQGLDQNAYSTAEARLQISPTMLQIDDKTLFLPSYMEYKRL